MSQRLRRSKAQGQYQSVLEQHLERVIWVDAVCINQQDNKKKGRQIQSIARVFGCARQVIGGLGDASNGGDSASRTHPDFKVTRWLV
jgi:hypothetical protein